MYKKIVAGLAGALVLNILHEAVRNRFAGAPRINELGEEALQKSLRPFNLTVDNPRSLYWATLSSDIVSNALYYGVTATTSPVISGALAGIGAVKLPQHLGLNDEPVAATPQRKLLTVSYYLVGALVTRAVYKALQR
ncbi:hypothetical protein U0035_05420 [Niabella yanshanensis]|uniref:Uncharacterized protein n=1 Tax=Niabella yanshanensis TaxID=577386 RepID=A0ABZ0WBP2_9BACT|nr:hypothetical protein [Niabella yanshanensis]WQD39585.1 hypothetical protein U0035_05420 [Niabella yanshanensis]